jgi:hypothetical protein
MNSPDSSMASPEQGPVATGAGHWFIARQGRTLGPFTAVELKQLVPAGMLRPADLIWVEGLCQWVPAARFTALFPTAAPQQYWLCVAGKTLGPFVADQLREGLAARQINRDTLVCLEHTTQWVPLKQLPKLAGCAAPARSSRACPPTGTLDAEQAEWYLAGKAGDALGKLISNLLDLKKAHADHPGLVENLEQSIQLLKAKRQEHTAGQKTS